MNAKEYLQQAYRLNELINSNLVELQQLRDFSTSIAPVDVSKERVQGGIDSHDKIGSIVAKIADLDDVINSDIDKLVDLKQEIRTTINNVSDNDEKLLLRYRYINFYTWDEICEKFDTSMRNVQRIHSSALQNIIVPTLY